MAKFTDIVTQSQPTIGTTKGFEIISAFWGAKDRWLDVTEKLSAKVINPITPFVFSNQDAGMDPYDGVTKSLVVKFIYEDEEKEKILAEHEIEPLIYKPLTTSVGAVKKNQEIDISAVMPRLKEQNPDMYREFFEVNSIELHPEHVAGKRVLDIGANRGFFSLVCRSHGATEVIAVEPDKSNFEALSSNVKGYGISPLNCAATDSRTSSVRMVDADSLAKAVPDKDGTIPAKSLSKLLALFPKDDNDIILKIDTEGSEYDILLDASGEDIRRFSRIFLEVHPVPHLEAHPARNATYIEHYLDYIGFKVESRHPLYWWDFDESGKPCNYREIGVEFRILVRK